MDEHVVIALATAIGAITTTLISSFTLYKIKQLEVGQKETHALVNNQMSHLVVASRAEGFAAGSGTQEVQP